MRISLVLVLSLTFLWQDARCQAVSSILEIPSERILSLSARGELLVVGTNKGKIHLRIGAETWTTVAPISESSSADILAVHIVSPDTILASADGAGGGLIFSHDAGVTWDLVSGLPRIRHLLETKDGLLLASSITGVLRSFDFGESWEETEAILQGISPNKLASINDTILVATSSISGVAGRFHYSWDAGLSWVDSTETFSRIGDLRATVRTPDGFVLFGQNVFEHISLPSQSSVTETAYFGSFQLESLNSRLYAVFSGELWESTDAGRSWLSLGIEAVSSSELYPVSDSTLYIARTGGLDLVRLLSATDTQNQSPEYPRFLVDVYPNPASNFITVRSDRNLTCNTISILDIRAAAVPIYKLTYSSNGVCMFDITNLSAGVYLVSNIIGADRFGRIVVVL